MAFTMARHFDLSAAVLAGGRSSRMGTDKALLRVGGRTLLERVIEVLQTTSDEVHIIGDRPEYHGFGVKVVADLHPGTGPLGGIATAIATASCEQVLVVACDMPFLSADLIRAMAMVPRDYDVLVPVTAAERSQQGDGQTFEALHAIYSKSCLPAIQESLNRREYRAVGFFHKVRVKQLEESWLRRFDPELRSLMNTNDAEELGNARDLERESKQFPEAEV
jgi:molybdenum cofactor guanylyltransferase